MNPVEQFLHHGLLPFVGREREIEHILEFWRGTIESQRLRALLLTAEAGAGKSRLLEECIKRIEGEGGVVVHVKFYPEAANDLAGLLSAALWNSPATRKLLGSRPAESIPAALTSLRRLGRLRPTVLVMEDLHLLTPEAIPDLAMLLGSVSDETLSLIALARPVQLQARGILENYLTEIIEMKGLEQADIADLWNRMFASVPKGKEVKVLEEITFGNGLALRSALRAVLQSGGLQERGRSGVWRLRISVPEFENMLRQSVSLVAEGLIGSLTPEMRTDLSRLAPLGEVFARETAERVIGSEERVAQLMETDLLIEAGHPVPPISGLPVSSVEVSWPASHYPLVAFTHSLLHNYLVETGNVEIGTLAAALAEDLPFYSLLPFPLLRLSTGLADIDTEILLQVLIRGFAVTQMVDRTSNWKEGYEKVWLTVEGILPELEGKISEDEYRIRRIMISAVKLSLLRREISADAWLIPLQEAMHHSEKVENAKEARARLIVCSHWFEWHSRHDYAFSLSVEEMVRPLLEDYPQLRYDVAYVYYIDGLASAAGRMGDMRTLRNTQVIVRELMDDPDLPDYLRDLVVQRLLKYALQIITSEEDIEECWKLIGIIEEQMDEEDPYYGINKMFFLESIGEFEEGADLAERVGQRCRDHAVWLNLLLCEAVRAVCRAGMGEPVNGLIERAKGIVAEGIGGGEERDLRESVMNHLFYVGLYRGEPDLPRICAELGLVEEELSPTHRGLYGIWVGDPDRAQLVASTDYNSYLEVTDETWKAWRKYLNEPSQETIATLRAVLESPVLRIQDLMNIGGTVRLWLTMNGVGSRDDREREEFRIVAVDGVKRCLALLERRSITPFAPPFIDLLGRLGEEEEGNVWEKRMGEVRKISGDDPVLTTSAETIRVSMLGTIRVAIPPENFVPIRGVRIRTLLGLMVADMMLARPLSPEEFLRLAGGDDPDPEHARKKKNMGVVRLREILGRDAILTDGETPRLNEQVVEVDLVEADRRIQDALTAVSEGALVRALPLVEEVLDIAGGEVAFPTLYDDFFEAVREDFEYRLRRAVIETARGLSEEGDNERGETLLRKGFEALPGDEEIGEMLRDALIASGNRVEAERVKIGMGAG